MRIVNNEKYVPDDAQKNFGRKYVFREEIIAVLRDVSAMDKILLQVTPSS